MIIKDIQDLLETKGIKPSITRVKIMDYLQKHRTHPTVDEIYRNLVQEIPTLSKTTVYNSLELFVENQLAQVLNVGDNERRYDADISDHGHFKCLYCGKVYDFGIDFENVRVEGLEGFQVYDKNVYCRGVCPHCKANEKRSN